MRYVRRSFYLIFKASQWKPKREEKNRIQTLFPLDCLKTRLQAVGGIHAAGGYRGLYSGMPAALAGSIPCSALFFLSYEASKKQIKLSDSGGRIPEWCICASAAAAGEVVACNIRVPTEIIKQQMQAGRVQTATEAAMIVRRNGVPGFVRAFRATAFRDVPFSVLQYPMYEGAKRSLSNRTGKPLAVWQSACVGACTGFVSAFLTTPLDVCKTRIMLGEPSSTHNTTLQFMRHITSTEGIAGLFRGSITRATWMGLGGLIFLGSYEQCKLFLVGPENEKSEFWA